ncbi:hypothetical protein C5167_035975 [Papaver somniferum]|nr:hypothetical protein C5167_035975 [Papaver somniferum]
MRFQTGQKSWNLQESYPQMSGKCVYEALDKGLPEWAKKMLRHSISKEVYKGNASGPTKVLDLVQKIKEHADPQCLSTAQRKEIDEFLCGKEIPKAPWDHGVCRLCGIDRSDGTVFLCDHYDSEYHTYCLIPPLHKIPIGNWYHPRVLRLVKRKRYQGEGTRILSEKLNKLAGVIEEKEYWDCSLEERVFLLKFFSDKVLNSAIVPEHLDQCAEMSADVQQKLRHSSIELRNLKYEEEVLTKESKVMLKGVGEAGKDAIAITTFCTPFSGMIQLGDVAEENDSNNVNNNWSFGKSNSGDHCNGSRNLSVLAADSDGQKTDGLSVLDGNHVLESLSPDKASKSSESNKNSEPMFEVLNEPRAYDLEVDSLKNEISSMENSIGGLESQLLKLSMCRDDEARNL